MQGKVLAGGDILYGQDLKCIKNSCIVIVDDKIKEILPKEKVINNNEYSDFEFIDAGENTLMPGMIDCHNHLSLDARVSGHLEMMNDSECELTLRALKTMKDDLKSGVTTARCMGDRFYIDVICRDAVRANKLIGPRLIVSGIGMRSIHGHGFVGLPHSGVEEIRRTTRNNLARGVDVIKLFNTKTVCETSKIPSFLSFEEIKCAADEAKRVGVKTAVHCIGGQGLTDCINAGIDVIEHGYYMVDDDIELMIKKDRWIDQTVSYFMDDDRNLTISRNSAESVRRQRQTMIDRVSKVIKSGLKFVIGTDGLHGKLAQEVKYIVELGGKPVDAIKGVTFNAAKVCGIEEFTGCIKEGYSADIITVEGNPLDDVTALSNVKMVIKEGRVQNF